MSEELNAAELVSMGVNLSSVSRPADYRVFQYKIWAESLVSRLRLAGLKNTLSVAEPLLAAVEDIADDTTGKFEERFEQRKTLLSERARAISDVLIGEAKSKTLILTDEEPTPAINNLPSLSDRQQLFLHDLVTCLKAHLARPAIIAAWTLGYDIVRAWIYEPTRLAEFNVALGTPQIKEYEDFYHLGERLVLDKCLKAQGALAGFTQKTHSSLVELLNDRNRFAHANDKEASVGRANVYVEKMVEIINEPPFKRELANS